MTQAQEILEMIEKVDPKDTAELDKIDARFRCFEEQVTYVRHEKTPQGHSCVWVEGWKLPFAVWQYTRSRDALKSIRPEGWRVRIEQCMLVGNVWFCTMYNSGVEFRKSLKTEELAELHVIIQAIEWERNNAG